MLFNIILNNLINDNNEYSVAFSSFILLLSNNTVYREDNIKRKYSIIKNQVFNNLSTENEKKRIFNFFNDLQKKYFILKRFFYKIYYKKCKFYEPQIDMSLNDLTKVKDHLKITLLHGNTKYVFSLTDLINIITTALTYNSGYFCTPQNIKNPYTNLNFSRSNLYNIYFKLKQSTFIMPILYHRYFLNNFDLRIFSAYNENLIKEATIENILQTNDNTKKFNFVKKMLGFFNKYRGKNKRITYDKNFPKKELISIFGIYLKDFLSAFFIQDENIYSHCRVNLFKNLDEFHLKNPIFGRKIISKSIKKLYYISVLNYDYGFEYDKFRYYISPPHLFDLEKRSVFITSKKIINYSIFLDKLEITYVNGWDFIKNGKAFYFDEKATKIIDDIIRPSISSEVTCSTHSSNSDDSDSDNEIPNHNNRRTTTHVDNIQTTVRTLDYYLDTINTLFDPESSTESESDEDIPIPDYDNDTIIEDHYILEPSDTVNNNNVDMNTDTNTDTNTIDSETNTQSAQIDNETLNSTTTNLINELDTNFNTHILNNELYDLSTEELNSSGDNNTN